MIANYDIDRVVPVADGRVKILCTDRNVLRAIVQREN